MATAESKWDRSHLGWLMNYVLTFIYAALHQASRLHGGSITMKSQIDITQMCVFYFPFRLKSHENKG